MILSFIILSHSVCCDWVSKSLWKRMHMICIASLVLAVLAGWRWVMAVSTSATSCYATFNGTAAAALHIQCVCFGFASSCASSSRKNGIFYVASNWIALLSVFFFFTDWSVTPQKPQSIYPTPNCHFYSPPSPPSYCVFIRHLSVLALPFS